MEKTAMKKTRSNPLTTSSSVSLVGQKALPIRLQSIDGELFDSSTLLGKPHMISFFRFAACPFCNLRLHQLVQNYDRFGGDFTIVAIFDSPLDNLQQHSTRHGAPFPILADETRYFYHQYDIKRSVWGMLKGMLIRFPSLLKAIVSHGYTPTSIKGKLDTMPADFLVDDSGIIKLAYHGKDEGDHLDIDIIEQFSHKKSLT